MASKAIIRKGDSTSHGGKVLEGHPTATIMGIPIAGIGHMTYCPQCKGTFPILEGVTNHTILGRQTTVEGMKTACGASLIATQHHDTIDITLSDNVNAIFSATILSLALASSAKSNSNHNYHEQVRLRDENGKPISNTPYYITDDSGNAFKGMTDNDGCCERIYTDSEQSLTIMTGVLALENW